MQLPENLRDHLKKPLGILLKDSDTSKENILKNIPSGSFIISVGDATTDKLIKYDIIPSLQIVDGLEKRSKRDLPASSEKTIFSCTCINPAAQITIESINAIKKALQNPPARIIVTGEEDLLVLPACTLAPQNSVVLYGQPNEGLVIVQINSEIRNKVQAIMDAMS
ncbi:MAG TPA: GTP-dependent dephospho-CoA kinase family protein [Nitrosopumilaceae archaeon]|nr:GTP-dependent dephospho-CoA kinase family protein [Nitrosopumilaceae archaeon]